MTEMPSVKIQPLVEGGLAVSPQIAVADVAKLAALGYKVIMNNRPDGEDPGQPTAAEIAAEAARHGIAYHQVAVTTPTIQAADVAAYAKIVAEAPGPILAHCRTGTRSYLLWAANQVLAHGVAASTLITNAAAHGFDISSLNVLLARLAG